MTPLIAISCGLLALAIGATVLRMPGIQRIMLGVVGAFQIVLLVFGFGVVSRGTVERFDVLEKEVAVEKIAAIQAHDRDQIQLRVSLGLLTVGLVVLCINKRRAESS